ncbi:hypothetical protein T265_05402 [Opisthorchis viverrini]|uniref:H15 domain-containing protein n=1 Tax=Opisthorchis viverrini TaxID=6198 RepID=A0A074ZKM3_OPIVI|nr:hypothetical protein T265_05402 [Opisthorchis viverrini]KER27586.1 hypothetical protein T265_05402 [Opisthorchis viverrini]
MACLSLDGTVKFVNSSIRPKAETHFRKRLDYTAMALVSVCGNRMTRGMSAPASAPAVSKRPKSTKPKIRVIDMVEFSINAAKDRKGTPSPIFKKFTTANYEVDVERLGPHIRRGIVHAVERAVLVRVGNKGKGVSESFKFAETKAAVAKPKPVKKPKVAKAKKPSVPKDE